MGAYLGPVAYMQSWAKMGLTHVISQACQSFPFPRPTHISHSVSMLTDQVLLYKNRIVYYLIFSFSTFPYQMCSFLHRYWNICFWELKERMGRKCILERNLGSLELWAIWKVQEKLPRQTILQSVPHPVHEVQSVPHPARFL